MSTGFQNAQQHPRSTAELPEHLRNLKVVLFSRSAELNARRNAFQTLARSSDAAAQSILQEFSKSGLSLQEHIEAPKQKIDVQTKR